MVVPLQGIDLCTFQVSPLCPTETQPQASLVVQVDGVAGSGGVTGNAGGLNCVAPNQCTIQVNVGTVVQLTASAGVASQFCGGNGDPDCSVTTSVVQVSLNQTATKTCVARFRPLPGACNP